MKLQWRKRSNSHEGEEMHCVILPDFYAIDAPSNIYKNQNNEKFDVMFGVNDDEGTIFANTLTGYGVNVTYGLPRNTFVQALKLGTLSIVIPDTKSVLINTTIFFYTDWTDVEGLNSNRRGYLDVTGDSLLIAPTIKAAQAYSKKKLGSTYLYFLEYRYDGPIFGTKIPSWVSASHGADVGFLFDPLFSDKWSQSANFSRAMIRLWSNFAYSGNPNSPDSVGITWPQYTPDKQQYLSLKPDMAVGSHLRAKYVQYWNQFVPDTINATATKPCKNECDVCSGSQDIKATETVILILPSALTLWL